MKCRTTKIMSILFIAFLLLGGMLLVSNPAYAASQNTSTVHSQTLHPAANAGVSVFVYATNVNVREEFTAGCFQNPNTGCPVLERISRVQVTGECQIQGESITDLGITNDWWSSVVTPDGTTGWVSNIYIQGGQTIAGEPIC